MIKLTFIHNKPYCVQWLNDKNEWHRVDGPALDYASGMQIWYLNGLRHRVGGPAVEMPSGHKEYYLHGVLYC